MHESLTVRAYQPDVRSHAHAFHQVVVPLRGVIEMQLLDFDVAIAPGHCVIIPQNTVHAFKARQQARFLVADLLSLPASMTASSPFASLSKAFLAFCTFAETQLSNQHDKEMEQHMLAIFRQLLAQQDFLPNIDKRISRVLEHIEKDLAGKHSLASLAEIATLSVSQFKVLFTRHTGKSLSEYLLMLRMQKARALLLNTDMPIAVIAGTIGYADQSAFSRRFQACFGQAPGEYKARN